MKVSIDFLDKLLNPLGKLLGRFYRSFLRWWELRGFYMKAIQQGEGNEKLKRAAVTILKKSDFFDKFIKSPAVPVEQELTEFFRRLKEDCPEIDDSSIFFFLESIYRNLAAEMEGHPLWAKRGEEIVKFLTQREQVVKASEKIETIPIQPIYISHFISPPVPKNFLDREDELEKLRGWLENRAQTICALVGIGGQGKTFLAAKLAEECKQSGWQVRWMRLPKTIDDLLRSIADEMQSQKNPYHAVVGDTNQMLDVRIDNAVRFLEGSEDRWLFVLDDFHKVGDDKDWQKFIAQLDCSCQRTKVLLTARREPEFPFNLPVGATTLWDVPPLPQKFTQAYLNACGLEVSQEEAESIWKKCRGNCEAMKLFAQAARRHPVETILGLPLPDWSTNALEWCNQLLSDLGEEEREAGKRLALFDEPVEVDLLLHLGATWRGLERLLDWRLVERLPDERYILHDITKEYWRKQTDEIEKKQWHKAAGEWLRQQAEEMQKKRPKKIDEWKLNEQKSWALFLYRAFWHFTDAGENVSALEVAEPITDFLNHWGEWTKNLRLCQKAYEIAKVLSDKKKIAYWAYMLAICYYCRDEYEEAQTLCHESLEINENLGDLKGQMVALNGLGLLAFYQGDYEESKRLYYKSLEISESLSDLKEKATILNNLGRLAYYQGEYEEAERLLCKSLEISKNLVDLKGIAAVLNSLGQLAYYRNQYEEAEKLYRESLKISERLDYLIIKALALNNLGRLACLQGKYEEAERLYRESLEIKEWLGDWNGKTKTLIQLGRLKERQYKFEEAERFINEGLSIVKQRLSSSKPLWADSLWALGQLRKAQGRIDEARKLLGQALEIFERIGDARAKDVRKDLEDLQEL